MSFTQIEKSIRLIRCGFCGTVATSDAELEAHGCLNDPGAQIFAIGDIVIAKFSVGQGMEYVGSIRAEGRVCAVNKPAALYHDPEADQCFFFSGFDRVGFQLPSNRHEWMYEVRPLVTEVKFGTAVPTICAQSLLSQ